MIRHPEPPSGAPLSAAYDAILADLDGTLIRGSEAIPGAAEALRRADVPVVYVTNNASKSPQAAADHLRGLGFDARAQDVMTSAQAAVVMLGRHLPVGAPVLVVGHRSFVDLAGEAGYRTVDGADDGPQAVLQGLSRELCWADLAEGCLALRNGALWIASNVDTTLPTERGLLPGNGSLVACLEAATGRTPLVAGKPAPGVLQAAAERICAERPLVVGDRLDTDIQGAVAAGMPALMVLTGVSGVADLPGLPADRRPTHLAEDLGALGRPESESRIAGTPSPEYSVDGHTLIVRAAATEGLELARGVLAALWEHDCTAIATTDPALGDRIAASGLPVH